MTRRRFTNVGRSSRLPSSKRAVRCLPIAAAIVATLVGCTGPERTLTRADFVDDPVFSIEIDGVEPEPILAGPIGGSSTNDRGYQAERIWAAVDDVAYRQLVADLVTADVAFHRATCFESATTVSGTMTLGSGALVGVVARHGLVNGSVSLQVTGLEPNDEGSSTLHPPEFPDIDDACSPELLSAAGLA